jgi:hypothetical protein
MVPQVLKLGDLVRYQSGSVVSKVILKQKGGNVTAFAFDAGQELSEHTAPFDALVSVMSGERHGGRGRGHHFWCAASSRHRREHRDAR